MKVPTGAMSSPFKPLAVTVQSLSTCFVWMNPACSIALRVLSACQHVAFVDVTCLHCAGFTKSRPKGLHGAIMPAFFLAYSYLFYEIMLH